MSKLTVYEYETEVLKLANRLLDIEECTACGYPKIKYVACERCAKQQKRKGLNAEA